jgi:uncharacterized protein
MKKLLLTILLALLACSLLTRAFAVKVSSLYQADIPVAAQTDDLKTQAVRDGFLDVLIKLSGDGQVGDNPVIKASLLRPDYYVHEISYSQPTPDASEYLLRIRYEPNDINRLLRKAGVSYWGEMRPLILVWLAITNKHQTTEIIGHEMPGDIFATMKHQSNRYGLPLIFPVMDVTDINQISPKDVISVSLPVLKEAAKRYAPDALLIGNMQETDNGIESQWLLMLNKNQWKWVITEKSVDLVISTLMNQISQTLAKHYVAKAADVPSVWVKVEVMNVTQRSDLTELLKYLKQLTPVQQVQLIEVSSDVVELSIQIRGSLETFQKNAAIGQRLSLKYQDPKDKKLFYVWVH